MQKNSLATRLGALVLAASFVVGGPALPPPALADEEGAPGAVSRYASASERRAAMAERRAALLRAAREEAERAGTVTAREPTQEEEAKPEQDSATTMQSMLRSLNPAVRPCHCRAVQSPPLRLRRACSWPDQSGWLILPRSGIHSFMTDPDPPAH